ncbi:hypothetical protein FQN54_001072 [Arachnomyces sp. PD_36]|nr:hypothetical protein FQN54_001072 [Arachnomyces sp. PD_36]
MPSLAFAEFEDAAETVIRILKTIPEFSNVKIVVIGGLSLWKYAREYRTTEDVDFLITAPGAPSSVKDKLLALPSSPFQQRAQLFEYKTPSGKALQIDMTPEWQSPYIPSAAATINSIQPGALPYISPLDLVAFKINSCGLRPTPEKKLRDASDAAYLLRKLSQNGPVTLSVDQKNAVLQGLNDAIQLTPMPPTWWKETMGLE